MGLPSLKPYSAEAAVITARLLKFEKGLSENAEQNCDEKGKILAFQFVPTILKGIVWQVSFASIVS